MNYTDETKTKVHLEAIWPKLPEQQQAKGNNWERDFKRGDFYVTDDYRTMYFSWPEFVLAGMFLAPRRVQYLGYLIACLAQFEIRQYISAGFRRKDLKARDTSGEAYNTLSHNCQTFCEELINTLWLNNWHSPKRLRQKHYLHKQIQDFKSTHYGWAWKSITRDGLKVKGYQRDDKRRLPPEPVKDSIKVPFMDDNDRRVAYEKSHQAWKSLLPGTKDDSATTRLINTLDYNVKAVQMAATYIKNTRIDVDEYHRLLAHADEYTYSHRMQHWFEDYSARAKVEAEDAIALAFLVSLNSIIEPVAVDILVFLSWIPWDEVGTGPVSVPVRILPGYERAQQSLPRSGEILHRYKLLAFDQEAFTVELDPRLRAATQAWSECVKRRLPVEDMFRHLVKVCSDGGDGGGHSRSDSLRSLGKVYMDHVVFLLEWALADEPAMELSDVLYAIGECAYNRRDFLSAKELFEMAIELKKRYIEGWDCDPDRQGFEVMLKKATDAVEREGLRRVDIARENLLSMPMISLPQS